MLSSPENRIMAIVHSCSGMSEDERCRFLDSACDGDAELRREVEILLAEGNEATGPHVVENHLARALPDHYRLIGIIGSGGMAEVFLAEDTRLDRRVAIKFLNDTFRRDPERMKRFKQEARSASALNHPNIITIHDIGENDGVQYIVSEFVEGETLGTRIERGWLAVEEALDIAIQIASALNAAHQAGVIHRDLKPDNIMLRRDGSVKVVDFGIAKAGAVFGASDDQSETAVSTSPGLILGTPKYMSPEQTRGTPLDARSDVFSFGIVLFEMLTGHSPFGGSNVVDVIAGIVGREPRNLADYIDDSSVHLTRIIHKALAKDRNERYQTASDVLADLRGLRSELSLPSSEFRQESGLSHGGSRALRLKRSWLWIGVPAALFAVIAGTWFIVGMRPVANSSGAMMRTVPITSWSSVSAEAVSAASFSPDAKMIAFSSTKTGATEIWVKPTTSGDPVQVTRNGFYNQYPIWSPDGQELAFFSDRGPTRGIWRISFTGGGEAQIAAGLPATARPLRWNRDKELYFTDGNELFSVDPGSGPAKQLTDFAAAGLKPRAMGLSADGKSVTISIKEDNVWKIKTKLLQSATFVDAATASDRVDSVVYHPEGNSIYYTTAVDGIVQIFQTTEGRPLQVSTGSTDVTLHDISADGSKILFSSVSETSDLWAVDPQLASQSLVANDMAEEYWPDISPDGKNVTYQSVGQADRPFRGTVMVKPAAPGGGSVVLSQEGFFPNWSPNGQWIAFLRRSGLNIDLWRVRPSGADASRVVAGSVSAPGYVSVPYLKLSRQFAWSPDSGTIAYLSMVNGVSNISLATLEAPSSKQLTRNDDRGESFRYVTFDASGKSVISYSDTGAGSARKVPAKLWAVPVDGTEPRIVFQAVESFSVLGLSESAEEVIIAQKSDPHDTSLAPAAIAISAIRLDTGEPRKLTVLANAYFNNIRLSREGDHLAYVTRSNGTTELWTLSTRGGRPRKVATEQDPKVLISSLDWSPGAIAIVFGRQTRTNLISMLTN